MTVPIRTHPVPATRKRRRVPRAAWKRVARMGAVAMVAALVWTIGWSSLFSVSDVGVTGIRTMDATDVRDAIGGGRTLPRIRVHDIESALMSRFAVIASVSVARDWPHGLSVTIKERTPAGIWCRADACTLFDRTGSRWGSAPPSRGTLLISVRDERPDDALTHELLAGLLATADGLPTYGIRAMLMTLPDQAPGDVVVTTDAGFSLVLDAYGDVADQLDTLGILMAEHAGDTTFTPTSIDVRTPGRIFYR